jgi:NTE family protein
MANRALVMSGGGSRGAFELGAADHLVNERGLDFQVIVGVSTGSLNAVVMAQGPGPEGLKSSIAELRSLWSGIRSDRDVFSSRFLGKLLALFAKDSVYSTRPLQEMIARHVSPERLRASGRQLRIGAVELETGLYRTIDQSDPRIREWALASASIPVLFPPVTIGDQTAVDGGVRNVTPLEDAFAALKSLGNGEGEPDEMYVVLASPLELAIDRSPKKSGLAIGRRAGEILLNEVFREDLTYAMAINESVRGFQGLRERLVARLGLSEAEAMLAVRRRLLRPPKFRPSRIWTIVPDTLLVGNAFSSIRPRSSRPLAPAARRPNACSPRRTCSSDWPPEQAQAAPRPGTVRGHAG